LTSEAASLSLSLSLSCSLSSFLSLFGSFIQPYPFFLDVLIYPEELLDSLQNAVSFARLIINPDFSLILIIIITPLCH